jgi:transposase
MEYAMANATIVKVHRHGQGAKRGTQNQAIGQSKGGWTTKILALPGQRHDTAGVAPLIAGIAFEGLIAGKAFDSNWIIAELNARGAKIVISQWPQRRLPLAINKELYKSRHLIEYLFGKLKGFKRIALSAEKTVNSFAAMIYLVSSITNSR